MSRRGKAQMLVIKKRGPDEWMEGDNIFILRGRAMQCLTYAELADSIGVTYRTLRDWINQYPEIAEAVELGRSEADDIIMALTHDQAVRGNEAALDRWWRYRIAPKMKSEDENEYKLTIEGLNSPGKETISSQILKQLLDDNTQRENGPRQ